MSAFRRRFIEWTELLELHSQSFTFVGLYTAPVELSNMFSIEKKFAGPVVTQAY